VPGADRSLRRGLRRVLRRTRSRRKDGEPLPQLGQRGAELASGGGTVVRLGGHTPVQEPFQLGRHPGPCDGRKVVAQDAGDQRGKARACLLGERRLPGQQRVEGGTERVDVRRSGRGPALEDLGSGVDDRIGGGLSRDTAGVIHIDHAGDPEVGQRRLAVGREQHVVRLDIAVQDTCFVGRVQCAAQASSDRDDLGDRQRALRGNLAGQ